MDNSSWVVVSTAVRSMLEEPSSSYDLFVRVSDGGRHAEYVTDASPSRSVLYTGFCGWDICRNRSQYDIPPSL